MDLNHIIRLMMVLAAMASIAADMALAQSETVTIYEQQTTVRQVINTQPGGSTTYEWNPPTYDIGMRNVGNYRYTYRSYSKFQFSDIIPSDAQIDNVTLIVTIMNFDEAGATFTERVVPIGTDIWNKTSQEVWNTIGSSTPSYFSGLVYNNTFFAEYSSAQLKQNFENTLSNGSFYLGHISNHESQDRSDASVNASLRVGFTRRVSITLQNAFNAGNLEADGSTYPSGQVLRWLKGSNHSLRSFSQTVNGVTYTTQNKWTNTTTGEVRNENPTTINVTSDATWRAEFGAGTVNITIRNSFDGGQVKVDGSLVNSGTTFTWTVGSQHTLEAFNQDFVDPNNNTNYYRVYRDWTDSRFPETADPANPKIISVTANATYSANFKKRYDISVPVATYIESGSGGTYNITRTSPPLNLTGQSSWSGTSLQDVDAPITLQAVPPAGGDWVFAQWSDGSRGNPRSVTPSDHTTLSAVFKRHLKANTSLALSPTGQRKLVLAETGTVNRLFLAYESGGGSFLTPQHSIDGSWDPEIFIGGLPTNSLLYREPAVTPDSTGTSFCVAYDVVNSSANTHTIRLDAFDKTTHTFFPLKDTENQPLIIGSFSGGAGIRSTPAIAISKTQSGFPSFLAATWRTASTLGFGFGTYITPSWLYVSGYSWSSVNLADVFQGTDFSNAINATVAIRTRSAGSTRLDIYVAWEVTGSNGGVRLIHGKYGPSLPWPPQATSIAWVTNSVMNVANNTSSVTHSKPALAIDQVGYLYLAYQTSNSSGGNITIQKRVADGSDYVESSHIYSDCGAKNPKSPMLSDYRHTSTRPNDITLVWTADNGVNCAQYTPSGGWGIPYVLSSGSVTAAQLQSTSSSDATTRSIMIAQPAGNLYALTSLVVSNPAGVPLSPLLEWLPNQVTSVGMAQTLKWFCSVGASSYQLQVSTSPTFSGGMIYDVSGITGNTYPIEGLDYSTWYYWRVRATNSNGTSAWSETWSFETYPYSPPSCPYVFGWNGREFRADNNLLPQSEYTGNEGKDLTDRYKLMLPPKLEEGHYVLEVKEFERERSFLDRITLTAIDHPKGTEVAVSASDGKIVQYTTPFALQPDDCQCNENEQRLRGFDGVTLTAKKGEELVLNFASIANATGTDGTQVRGFADQQPSGVVLMGRVLPPDGERAPMSGPPPDKKQVVGTFTGGQNFATGVPQSFTFRERSSFVYVPADPLVVAPDGELRILLGERVELDYVTLAVPLAQPNYTIRELPLIGATHSEQGEIASVLGAADNRYGTLRPGESIRLAFAALPEPDAQTVRSFVITVQGRYDKGDGVATVAIPREFMLEQNYPNPFNPQTSIRYQVPGEGAQVSITVFDVLGKELARLVDGAVEAGFHVTSWDAAESPSGIYYMRMVAADLSGKELFRSTRKMVLAR